MFDPWWPLALLAAVQLVDAVLGWRPVGFVAECLRNVNFPRRYWKLLPVLKLASAVGLLLGIWFPPLAVLTSGALVVYFVLAVTAHVRASDFGRNLFVGASGMLAACTACLVFTIGWAPA